MPGWEIIGKDEKNSVINLFNVLAWVIDGLTGAVQQFDQKAYNVQLEKK